MTDEPRPLDEGMAGRLLITVAAKTHHYWQAHVADLGRVARDADRG